MVTEDGRHHRHHLRQPNNRPSDEQHGPRSGHPVTVLAVTDRFQVVPAAYVVLRRSDIGDEVLLQLREGTGYMDGHCATAAAGHVEAGSAF